MLEALCLLLFLTAPLGIQYVLYLSAKLLLKRIPRPILYAGCFLLNSVILAILHYYFCLPEPDDMEPMDGFTGLFLGMIWLPFYLGVLLSGIVRIIRFFRKKVQNGASAAVSEPDGKE